jgi:hypothetical protein
MTAPAERYVPAALRVLDGRLPALLAAAGFQTSRRFGALRTVWGTLEGWRAERSSH